MILLNRSQFILAQVLGTIIFGSLDIQEVISDWGNDAAVLLLILSYIYFIYIFYSRVIDANKDVCFSHFYISLQIMHLFVAKFSNIAEVLSFLLCAAFCFYRESLIAVIAYQDENKAIEKLKKCKNFSNEEPLDVLIDTAKKRGKYDVLRYLEGLGR